MLKWIGLQVLTNSQPVGPNAVSELSVCQCWSTFGERCKKESCIYFRKVTLENKVFQWTRSSDKSRKIQVWYRGNRFRKLKKKQVSVRFQGNGCKLKEKNRSKTAVKERGMKTKDWLETANSFNAHGNGDPCQFRGTRSVDDGHGILEKKRPTVRNNSPKKRHVARMSLLAIVFYKFPGYRDFPYLFF